MHCKTCSNTELEVDNMLGISYCSACGTVNDDGMVVSTLEFTKNKELCGQLVSMKDNFTRMGDKLVLVGNHYVENSIKTICTSLGLSGEQANSAFRWYKLSLQHNLTKGRSIFYTISACIYIVCRQEATPHMLMDFSVLLKIDVFKIGKIFLKIVKLLDVNVPLVDPSLYINRFFKKLDFKNEKILNLALKLLSRMKRDWIVVGRRPNNICGAVLLIASRVYGEERSISEIARTVHVSVITINKRLEELSKTKTANLSLHDFYNVWIEVEDDPPCYKMQTIIEEGMITPDEEDSCLKDTFKENKTNIPTNKYVAEEKIPVDEESLDEFILSNEESKNREKIWEEMYGDFLKEKAERKSKQPHVFRKKKSKKKHATVQHAIDHLCKEKKLTNKINYAMLKKALE